MGVPEIVGFAICWVVVASLMLWGVFTEHKRGVTAAPAVDNRAMDWHPSRVRVSPSDWVVIEAADGATAEVKEHALFLAAAWLAARGIEMGSLPPADLRTEVTIVGDGTSCTRVMVRAAALHGSRRRP